jgi:hypothetical protein
MSLIVKEPEKKKPTPWAKFAWIKASEDNFTLRVGYEFLARIYKDAGLWKSAVMTKSGVDRVEHPDLETAAKYVDAFLYKKFPRVWTITDARVILTPWKGDLTFEEAKG